MNQRFKPKSLKNTELSDIEVNSATWNIIAETDSKNSEFISRMREREKELYNVYFKELKKQDQNIGMYQTDGFKKQETTGLDEEEQVQQEALS